MEGYLERPLLARQSQAGREVGERQPMAHQSRWLEPFLAQEPPDRRLFGEAAGVGADQTLLVLEEVVEREAGRLAGASVREEDRRPSGPQGRERCGGEGAAADAVEDGIGAAPVRTGRARCGQESVAGSGRLVRSELECQAPAVLAGIDDDDADDGVEGPQDEEVEQPHAAATEDGCHPSLRLAASAYRLRRRRLEHCALAHAAQDAGGRFEEEGIEITEAVGKPARRRGEGARPDDHPLGEPAGNEEVLAKGRTLGFGAAPAVEATAARRMVRHDQAIAGGKGVDLRSGRDDLADDFVAQYRPGGRAAGRQLEQIGAAQAAPPQLQDQLSWSRLRVGQRPPSRLAAVVDRDGAHRGVSFHQMERRIHRRLARRIELRFWRPGEAQGHTAYTTNISQSGLFLNTSISLMPGERLRLEVVDREHGFIAEGRVARVHRVALALRQVEQQGVGVRFLLPEELVEALVPHARQSGPATQGTRPAAPEERAGSGGAGAAGAQDDPGSEDGASPELDRDNVVPVHFPDPSSFLSTYHRDISAGGLFVSTPHPLELHAAVWIEMQLPIPGERPRLFAARVVQRFEPQAAVGTGRNFLSGMAVQFVEPEMVLAELKPLLAVLRR